MDHDPLLLNVRIDYLCPGQRVAKKERNFFAVTALWGRAYDL
jgi:hypothetical protein